MSDHNTQDGAEPSPAPAGSHGPLFTERLRLSKQAEEWCDGKRVPYHPINIVTALFSLGLVVKRPALTDEEQQAIEDAVDVFAESAIHIDNEADRRRAETLRGLLRRLS